jgi:hypothetical protein
MILAVQICPPESIVIYIFACLSDYRQGLGLEVGFIDHLQIRVYK